MALAAAAALPAEAFRVQVVPPSPRQGEAVVVLVTGLEGVRKVEGSLGGRPLDFFRHAGGLAAVTGVDIDVQPGPSPWHVDAVPRAGRTRQQQGSIHVRARDFPVQRLTVPPHMADLDPETERRAVAESARLRELWDATTPQRLWRGPFLRPVPGTEPGTGFGARRIINGQPRMPHSGVDYSGERGTPVVAANRGRVALVGEFFFPGRFVALDHGLGLYTVYMHLDRVDVGEGVVVERGQVIGAVGATGRATGPHLHFGAQLGRARVDAETLYALPLRD